MTPQKKVDWCETTVGLENMYVSVNAVIMKGNEEGSILTY
jgi:hypothetical protein